MQQPGALLITDPHRAVTAAVGFMAGGLIAQQINLYFLIGRILQQLHNITMIGNREWFFSFHRFTSPVERLL